MPTVDTLSPEHVLRDVRYSTHFYKCSSEVRIMYDLGDMEFVRLEWPKYAWPGGYEIHYIAPDGGVLCADCANEEIMRTIDPDDEQFHVVAQDIHYEGEDIYCDHCGRPIPPAYGND